MFRSFIYFDEKKMYTYLKQIDKGKFSVSPDSEICEKLMEHIVNEDMDEMFVKMSLVL